jgi:hypothetical protein
VPAVINNSAFVESFCGHLAVALFVSATPVSAFLGS